MRYLSHLIGHEAKGSILALLRDKGWANDLSSGESHSNSDWSSFAINIDLTDRYWKMFTRGSKQAFLCLLVGTENDFLEEYEAFCETSN